MQTKLIGTSDGISLFELSNADMSVQISTYGARIHKILVKDKNGDVQDVVAGFEKPEEFRGDNPYFNAVIGRVANRVGGASFSLGGKTFSLFKNDGNNHLHGGKEGFDRKNWQAEIVDDSALKLTYL